MRPRATDDGARRVKTLILEVKVDRVDPASGEPVVRRLISRVASRLGPAFRDGFEGDPVLVPVPRAGLTKAKTIWPASRVCEELRHAGLGIDVMPIVTRITAVDKSAGAASRPTFQEHLDSFAVQPGLRPPGRVIVVDDVVTSGTTLMGCAVKLAMTYPGVPISASLSHVCKAWAILRVLDPVVE